MIALRILKPVFLFSLVLLFASCSVWHPNSAKDTKANFSSAEKAPRGIYESLPFIKTHAHQNGVYTIECGGQSFVSRLWLFEHAQKSIDIQYYSFAKDVTGLIACDYLIRAADRGVKVRILIDDAESKMYSYEVQLLESHENIEIRVYNAGLRLGRPDRRLPRLFKNSNRMLRRMHNKTLTVDEEAGITGGRNIADEYFDYDRKYNFRDRDLLFIGHAVSEVKHSFEEFWNSSLTVAYSDLAGKSKKWYNDAHRFERLHRKASETKEFSQEMKNKVHAFPQELTKADESGELVWLGKLSFVSDKPGKNEDRSNRTGGVSTDSLLNLIRHAKKTLDIQSPYFITTEESKQAISDAINRGVKVRLLTNSLCSTDNLEAFSAYQKDREAIVKMGVEVHEFRPDAQERFKLMIPEIQSTINYKATFGFHSKTLVVDNAVSVIGSYNVDPRSANYNTECFAIIRSDEVAKHLSKYIEEEFLPANSWLVTQTCNPDSKASLKKRFKTWLSRIVPKKLV